MKLKIIFIYTVLAVMLFTSVRVQNVYAQQNIVNMDLVYDGKTHKYSAKPVCITFNGIEITTTIMPAIILDDKTLVPAREVFEAFGAVVDWKDETKEAYIGYGENLIVLTMGSTLANLNGQVIEMEVPARIINDKVMIPARFPATSLGFSVDWDKETRTVLVTDNVDTPQDIIDTDDSTAQIVTDNSMEDGTVFADQQPEALPSDMQNVIMAQDVSANEIATIPYAATDIISIQTPVQSGNDTYMINARSEISKVEKILLPDNRLIVDIYNSTLLIENKNIVIDSVNVSAVRSAQNQVVPEKITRVVFDLKSSAKYDVSISQDRKSIIVSFSQNIISSITFETVNNFDVIKISGAAAPVVNTFTLANPNRVVIDIPFSLLEALPNDIAVSGTYATMLRYAQFDANTVRVVLETLQFPHIGISRSGNTTTIQLAKSTYENIRYADNERTLVLTKNPSAPININEIGHKDNYNSLNYVLTLPGDYSLFYGFGEMPINTDRVKSINIQTDNGKTSLKLNEAQIIAVTVSEDDVNIYIKIQLPKEKYKKIVLIDPGHGLQDPGTSGNGLVEKTINLNLALKVMKIFDNDPSIKAYCTRLTDTYPTNPSRAELGNNIADLFVSIHHNAGYNKNPIPRGTEVLYYSHSNEDPNGITSKKMAQIMLDNITADCNTVKRSLISSPNVIVLNQTKIPAVLLEFGFVTNKEDAKLIISEDFQNKAANAVYRSVVQIFDTYKVGR